MGMGKSENLKLVLFLSTHDSTFILEYLFLHLWRRFNVYRSVENKASLSAAKSCTVLPRTSGPPQPLVPERGKRGPDQQQHKQGNKWREPCLGHCFLLPFSWLQKPTAQESSEPQPEPEEPWQVLLVFFCIPGYPVGGTVTMWRRAKTPSWQLRPKPGPVSEAILDLPTSVMPGQHPLPVFQASQLTFSSELWAHIPKPPNHKQ